MFDDWEWGSKDEDDWAKVGDKCCRRVADLLDFLVLLKVIGPGTNFDGQGDLYVEEFVDRHWKV
jgi:hypothetical protein